MHRKAGANVGKVRTKETARSVSESPEDDTALPTALTITRRKNIVTHQASSSIAVRDRCQDVTAEPRT